MGMEALRACAEVTLTEGTLSVEYGAKPGTCTYRGHSFAGTHVIAIERNEDAAVVVQHTWTEFTNGVVTLNGTAQVTWNFQDKQPIDDEVFTQFGTNPSAPAYNHGEYLRDVVAALQTKKAALVDGLEGRKSLELITALYG